MRPTKDQYFMELAKVAATRTTCIRRGVGCVLADTRGHVMSIGYNGVASGMAHCNELTMPRHPTSYTTGYYKRACKGHDLPPGQDFCEAVHAETNALLQCRDPWSIETAYVTLSPCKACLKLLLNTSCKRIVFLEEHTDLAPRELWEKLGRDWEKWEKRHE
jgi:dCMP deaminase